MSDLLNTYEKVAKAQYTTKQKVMEFVKSSLPFLILLLNIVLAVVSRLFRTDFQNPFTVDFFIELFTNMLTTMLCYICFVSYGQKNELSASKAYATNLELWKKMSAQVRSQSSDKFIRYCRKQVEIEREDMRHFYILNHTMITVEEYESEYKKLSDYEIDRLAESGKLNRKEAKYIKKANKSRNLKPINPIVILCGVSKMSLNDVGRDGMSAAKMAIITRPIYMFVITAVVTMFSGYWRGLDGASAVFDIIYSVLMIVVASVSGYSAGEDAGRTEHDRIKGRIFFLERYLATETTEE